MSVAGDYFPGVSSGTPYGLSFPGSLSAGARGYQMGLSSSGGLGMMDFVVPGLNFILGQIGSELDMGRQRRLMAEQYKYNLEQWNRQNVYDSPAAQMQRFRDAGLNPDLVYGQMGNGSTMQPSVSEQNVNSSARDYRLTAGLQARLQMEQYELNRQSVESQVALNESLAEKNRADARNKDAGTQWTYRRITSQDIIDELSRSNIVVNNERARVLSEQVNEIGAHIMMMQAQGRYFDAQTAIANIDKEFKSDWWRAQIRELKSRANLNDKEAERLEQVISELKESWEYRLDGFKADSAEAAAREVVAMATQAANRWKYLLGEDGKPLPSKAGAVVQVLDTLTGFVGRIFGVSTNFNEFTNHSSWQEVKPGTKNPVKYHNAN